MTYHDAMEELAVRCNDAYLGAIDAFKAADNEDGAPAHDLRDIKHKLDAIAKDVESLINYGATVKEFRAQEALYRGAKLAGLVK